MQRLSREALWTFVQVEGIAPTNNVADHLEEDVSARPTEQPCASDRHKTGTQSQRHDPHGVPTVPTCTHWCYSRCWIHQCVQVGTAERRDKT